MSGSAAACFEVLSRGKSMYFFNGMGTGFGAFPG